jgi:hypothetical protein
VWATTPARNLRPSCCLPPARPSRHGIRLRDMDVQELGSPGHPRSNRALFCVAFSTKRKCAPLARSISPALRPPPESGRARVRCGARREGEGSSAQQEPLDMETAGVGGCPALRDVLPDVAPASSPAPAPFYAHSLSRRFLPQLSIFFSVSLQWQVSPRTTP